MDVKGSEDKWLLNLNIMGETDAVRYTPHTKVSVVSISLQCDIVQAMNRAQPSEEINTLLQGP